MKIREGFVSNSSSSSFIVAFKEVPKSEQELKELLYGDEQEVKSGWMQEEPISTERLARHVWNDLKNSKPLSLSELGDALHGVRDNTYPSIPYPYDFKSRVDEEVFEMLVERRSMAIASDFLEQADGKVIYEFSYSDDSTIGAVLEHQGTFDNVQHIKISHH